MNRILRGMAVLAVGAVCALGSLRASERGTDVTFRGELQRLEQESIGKGKIVVRLHEAELQVRINTETQVENQGNIIGMGELGVGQLVQVIGFFSKTGIEAKEVQVLDDRGAEFRIRGTIDSVRQSGGTTVIGIASGNIVADDNTKIVRRGSDDRWNASNLSAGQEIDVRGKIEDGRFVAASMAVGKRADEGVRVRFEGTLLQVEGRRLTLDTRGGGNAVVVVDDSTLLKGNISLGGEYEISGKLNQRLEVVADWVKSEIEPMDDHGIDPKLVDDKGGKDNPPDGVPMVRKEINLSSMVSGSRLEGHASMSFASVAGNSQQEFEVEIENAEPGKAYQIEVGYGAGTISLGSLTADSKGKGKAKFSTNASGGNDLRSALPSGVDVRKITGVRVLLNGMPVLSGQF